MFPVLTVFYRTGKAIRPSPTTHQSHPRTRNLPAVGDHPHGGAQPRIRSRAPPTRAQRNSVHPPPRRPPSKALRDSDDRGDQARNDDTDQHHDAGTTRQRPVADPLRGPRGHHAPPA